MTNPFLHFDFYRKPITFKNPIKIIAATKIEQVLPSLLEVQQAIMNGYYAAGFISYEAGPAFNPHMDVHPNHKMPLLWFGIYNNVSNEELSPKGSFYTSNWESDTDINQYQKSIQSIKDYIRVGDSYQVNYTIRMNAQFHGDPIAYYQQLIHSQSTNYGVYLDIGHYKIISASPELFFHLKKGKVITRPMKGTISRGDNPKDDKANADWLFHSEKNRAENVMIVDLLRNDLGRIAKPGTVKVPKLFSIEAYPTVYQMTSTVEAEIDSKKGILEVLQALFPCGSITGAPKISTMKIIKELENTPREVYCGAIGYITPENEAIFNVPIRTVVLDSDGKATYGVGGGITWDSNKEDEYEEVLTKAKVLSKGQQSFQLIETIGLIAGEYIVLENHLNRLSKSANYFSFSFHLNKLRKKLDEIALLYSKGKWKVRVLLGRDGLTSLEVTEENMIEGKPIVTLASRPINKLDIFHYHKTTKRDIYEELFEPDLFDVLLWNENQEITEFTKGNVVVEMNGTLYTPPVECGLLAGTYREMLLQKEEIHERTISIKELNQCQRIWFINSVKEWLPVQLK
ncbi:aminodeoxychorismate synthase component I [Ornithinibacillus bavariensis]|uniref:aminodeoxychorismate synthase component I n=1 Tax=Ornithinibacillus bavariensis TaxID=545502 RepID=UPI000EC5A633|nr:aminodeoxychorismate synthase component I [Ornithinibacillus sp.]